MKKMLFAAILGAAMAVPFSVQAQGMYAGIGLGQSSYDVDGDSANGDAWKLYGGFEFDQNWGVEIGYADFGKLSSSVDMGGTTASASVKSHSLYLAGTGTMPLSEQFSIFGKLGLAANRSKADVSVSGGGSSMSASGSGSDSAIMFGVGAAYNLTKNVAFSLEYENFGNIADGVKASMWSLGARYKF